MRSFPFPLVLACLAAGCGDAPTATEGLAPDFAVSGNSGCATVAFNVRGVPPVSIPVTGDLVGTFTGTGGGDFKLTGATVANGGIAIWDITGGVLGPLTFQTSFDNRNILTDRPGSPGTLFENIGKHRALDGVEKANLTYSGTFSLITFEIDHDYRGVICP